MGDSGDMNPPVLNLSPDEKRVFSQLFQQADTDRLGVVTGEVAVKFFEKTKLAPNVLGEIWQLADTENRGLLTKAGFCVALRLIAHYQAGRDPTPELAFKPGGIPKFDGVNLAPSSPAVATSQPNPLQPQGSGIRIPPIIPEKAAQYSGLFERSGAQGGLLSGEAARSIFERAGLPNEILGRIWSLADREQKGALDITEFIIAMHLITSFKSRTMTALPSALPPGLYEAAQRRGQPGPRPQGPPSAVSRQFTGPQRTSSPLARPPYGAAPAQVAQTTGSNWLITPQEKAKYDQFFDNIDTNRSGYLTGEQAVKFFNDSGLSEETLASIWDLADIRSEGQLNRDEFAVAMYLIRQSRSGSSLPAFLPAALVPPSMRNQPQAQPQQQQAAPSTAPNFDVPSNNTPQMPKSAADDLFGLDSSPVKAAPQQTIQTTGGSAAGKSPFDTDPFSNDRAQPFTPQFTGQSGQSNMFKPFQPTSAFGASLAVENTGGSAASSQPQARSPQIPQPSANDDLLGDGDEEQSKKLTEETTELANMSTQIGNLRNQMQDVQTKRTTHERDVANTNSQKQELQQRLAQFRSQYEQEVQTVKSLEQQLTASRNETRKLQQEFAMIEGSHQDLQTQHAQISQALEADRAENANLKARISQLNTEISQLKPQIDKMRSEARQQKGMVAINKKQLSTNEGERDKLNNEISDLTKSQELEQSRSAATSPVPTSSVASPAPSVNTNPFFRKPSGPAPAEGTPSGVQSPTTGFLAGAPSPSAFDALFGPAASKSNTPPPVSFTRPDVDQTRSVSSGRPTPTASPPPVVRSMSPSSAEAPPPPESRQFTPGMLPIHTTGSRTGSITSSTKAMPPASAIDAVSTNNTGPSGTAARGFGSSPFDEDTSSDAATLVPGGDSQRPGIVGNPSTMSLSKDAIPGAFPDESSPQKAPAQAVPASSNDDFDAAFADFGKPANSKDGNADVFGPRGDAPKADEQFYPMTEPAEDSSSDDDDEDGFDDNFGTPTPKTNGAAAAGKPATEETTSTALPAIQTTSEPPPAENAQSSPPPYEPKNGNSNFPHEFDGLLPAREDPTASPRLHSVPSNSAHASTPSGGSSLFPGSATSDVFQDASSRPLSTWDDTPAGPTPSSAIPKPSNAFDEFDDFADLSEAKAADDTSKFDFPDNQSEAEFNPTFDSPAASMTTAGMASSQQTPQPPQSNGFSDFGKVDMDSAFTKRSGSTGATSAGAGGAHDWDAIFSGLDSSAPAPAKELGTPELPSSESRGDDAATPKATSPIAAMAPAGSRPDLTERSMSESSEHDDPILKRLTGMGYPRQKALDALEKYDYDINKVSPSPQPLLGGERARAGRDVMESKG
ncbi:Cytoskeletal-regulatory complex EF hand-like protein [Elsinoe fawcettii]|nr:Cytoskeletal-regulatory complex EF hand-like protein [Elsinoe fawcettii]